MDGFTASPQAILDERAAEPRDDILSLFVTTESDGDRLPPLRFVPDLQVSWPA